MLVDGTKDLEKAYGIAEKQRVKKSRPLLRSSQLRWKLLLKSWVMRSIAFSPVVCSNHLEADVVRGAILKTGTRIDGRDTSTVRQIVAEVGVLPRAHGSALIHPW